MVIIIIIIIIFIFDSWTKKNTAHRNQVYHNHMNTHTHTNQWIVKNWIKEREKNDNVDLSNRFNDKQHFFCQIDRFCFVTWSFYVESILFLSYSSYQVTNLSFFLVPVKFFISVYFYCGCWKWLISLF